jgi:S1-C subfamily serine protease
MVPYTATVHHHGIKTVQASLVSYDSKTGNVVLKIKEDRTRNEVERSFRYAALGDDDKKYLDSVRTQQTGQ